MSVGMAIAGMRPVPELMFLMRGTNDFIMGCGLGVVRANLMAMVHQMYHTRIPVILGIEIAGDSAHVRPDWQQLADFHQVNEKIRAMAEWQPGFGSLMRDGNRRSGSDTFCLLCFLFQKLLQTGNLL
ncbi:MAG: hypothetical protein HFI41_14960 [Lachnospiraceae bacterium]|nr:hypothetical protein [Lachnospiraceae bacterium]